MKPNNNLTSDTKKSRFCQDVCVCSKDFRCVSLLRSSRRQQKLTEIFSLSPIRARKSKTLAFTIVEEQEHQIEINQEKKQRFDTKNQAKKIKSKTFLGSIREKIDITIAILVNWIILQHHNNFTFLGRSYLLKLSQLKRKMRLLCQNI